MPLGFFWKFCLLALKLEKYTTLVDDSGSSTFSVSGLTRRVRQINVKSVCGVDGLTYLARKVAGDGTRLSGVSGALSDSTRTASGFAASLMLLTLVAAAPFVSEGEEDGGFWDLRSCWRNANALMTVRFVLVDIFTGTITFPVDAMPQIHSYLVRPGSRWHWGYQSFFFSLSPWSGHYIGGIEERNIMQIILH